MSIRELATNGVTRVFHGEDAPSSAVRRPCSGRTLLPIALRVLLVATACCVPGATASAQTISGTFAGPILSGSTVTLVNGASIVGDVSNEGTLEFALTGSTMNVTYPISGVGGQVLVNSPDSTITLSGTNTYSGGGYGTTVNYGTLVIPLGGSVSHPTTNLYVGYVNSANGSLTISGGSVSSFDGTLGFNTASQATVTMSSGTWSMGGDLNVGYSGTGSMTLSGGSVNVAGSAIIGRDATSQGTLTMSGGTMAIVGALEVGYSGPGTLSVTGGSITSGISYIAQNGGSGTASIGNGSWSITGDLFIGLDGDGTLNIDDGGIVQVAGALNRGTTSGSTGTLNLNGGGTLIIGAGATAGTLNTAVANNGTLIFDQATDSTYSYLITGTGAVVKDGAGTLTLNTANGYSGGTTIVGGAITVTGSGVIDHPAAAIVIGSSGGDVGGLNVIASGSVAASRLDVYNGTFGVAGNGSAITADTATIGLSGVGSGTVGNGSFLTLVDGLTIGSSGTGTLVIDAGTLTTGGSAGPTGDTTLGAGGGSGGLSVINGGFWNSYGNVTVNSGSLAITNGQVVLTGTLSQGGSGTITVGGQGILTIGDGSNGYTTGGLTATAVANDGAIVFRRATDTSSQASISGAGSLTKYESGALTLTGTSTYTGATHVTAGALYVDGQLGLTAVAMDANTLLGGSGTIEGAVTITSGTLSPGSLSDPLATLTVGDLTISGNDSYTLMTISGSNVGEYDQFAAADPGNTSITYDGILELTMTGTNAGGPYDYANLTTFHLFSGFSSTGTSNFSSVVLNAAGTRYNGLVFTFQDGIGWQTQWTNESIGQRLVFNLSTGDMVVVPEPGTLALAGMAVVSLVAAARWRRRAGTDRAALAGAAVAPVAPTLAGSSPWSA